MRKTITKETKIQANNILCELLALYVAFNNLNYNSEITVPFLYNVAEFIENSSKQLKKLVKKLEAANEPPPDTVIDSLGGSYE